MTRGRKPNGRVLRPEAVVLPDAAVVPEASLGAAPARLTHEVVREAPFYFSRAARGTPAGTLPAGTRVVAPARPRAARCRVVREDGLAVYIPCDALKAL